MIPVYKSLILNSHFTKWINVKNVWKFNLKTIAMIIMYRHGCKNPWHLLVEDIFPHLTHKTHWNCIYKFYPYITTYKLCTSPLIYLKNGETLKVKKGLLYYERHRKRFFKKS